MKKQSGTAKSYGRRAANRSGLPKQSSTFGSVKWLIIPLAISVVIVILITAMKGMSTNTTSPQETKKQQAIQQLFATVPASSASRSHSNAPIPISQPTQPRYIGITNLPQAPFSPTIFVARNSWQGPIGSKWLFAYAGAKATADGTPGQGGIVLYTQVATASGNFDFYPIGTFLASSGTKALTIVTVNGNLMKLDSEAGREFTFNLQTYQYH